MLIASVYISWTLLCHFTIFLICIHSQHVIATALVLSFEFAWRGDHDAKEESSTVEMGHSITDCRAILCYFPLRGIYLLVQTPHTLVSLK